MTTPSSELPKLGRYEILRKIAQGGMAEIFLGKAVGVMGFERLVAIKLIHQHLTRDDSFVKMFIDEARIAMHLQHRNIVQVFDLDQFEGTYFIAMEYVHGVNLYDLYERIAAQNRWFDLPLALYIIAETCKGLHFAHTRVGPDGRSMGIVHRDISPQNILLSFEGEVKITDFGIAKAAERLHQTTPGIVKGKYAYMAPEILQEQPPDARVDVFAAGVVLYELLVGENPYAGKTPVETIEKVLSYDVPAPSKRGSTGTRELDLIVAKALAKDPNRRFQTALELQDALTEYGFNLTRARRELAAGDSQVAEILLELFPEQAKEQGRADPSSVHLPVAQTLPTDPAAESARPQIVDAPDEQLGSSDATLLEFDAPLAVKEARLLDEPGVGDSNDKTLPMHAISLADIAATEQEAPKNPLVAPVPLVVETSRPPVPEPGHVARPESILAQTARPPIPQPLAPRPQQPKPQQPPPVGNQNTGAQPRRVSEASILPSMLSPVRKQSQLPLIAGAAAAVLTSGAALFLFLSPISLSVISEPPGAAVTVDGKLQLGRTPLSVELSAGEEHVIGVDAIGYESFKSSVLFPRGTRPTPLLARLERQVGRIVVRASQKDARVTINGADTRSGDTAFEGLELGKPYVLRIDRVGFQTYETTVTLTVAKREELLDIKLTPEK
ncbi:MAG: serine/threonine protein kinase [Deltaproteobacteria bacterium]|nr:serine/threonine protein kinase [Deltaproteobacteria bacterium]